MVIASSILSVIVFGIYRLVWENYKISNNSDNLIESNIFFEPLENCIKKIWFFTFKTSNQINYEFNFWDSLTWCLIWNSNTIVLNDLEYKLSWEITNSWSSFINWDLQVSSENTKKVRKDFIQINTN